MVITRDDTMRYILKYAIFVLVLVGGNLNGEQSSRRRWRPLYFKRGAFRANGVRKLDYQLGDDMTECTESYKDMSF